MNIGGVEISNPERPVVVAEIGCNHNGDEGLARSLIENAAVQGADLIKFQCYLPQELIALRGDGPAPGPWAGRTMLELYQQAQTPLKWFPRLIERCREFGIPWFASVFGLGSLAFMEAMDCPAYKLAALDFASRRHRNAVEATGKPVIRSSPGPRAPGFTLWCPPGYPQALVKGELRREMKRFDGFSYHGTDPFMPALAAAFGAKMIEVHVQLDDVPSVLDAHSSLTVTQLGALIGMVRTAKAVA